LILKELAVWGDDAAPFEPGGAPVWLAWVDPFDLAQGKRAEGSGQPTVRMGLGEWDEILRYAQDERWGRSVKRGFVERGRRLEMVRRKRVLCTERGHKFLLRVEFWDFG